MKRLFLFLPIFATAFLLSGAVNAAYAQVFKFELGTAAGDVKVGSPVQVKILINTAGQQTINGDALFTFDPSGISVDSATTGNFYTYFSALPLGGSTTKYLVSSYEESVAHAKSTSTDTLFATLNLTLKSSPTTLSFDCTSGTGSDSNINRSSDSKDIIVCPLTPLTITASGPTVTPGTPTATLTPGPTSTPSATPTKKPTSTPVPTNTPKPTATELPRSGSIEITTFALGIGALLTVVGVLFIL